MYISKLFFDRYMWQPYMERLQANIFAQHVILILTDYALGYTRNNGDQQVVLQFSKNEASSNIHVQIHVDSILDEYT